MASRKPAATSEPLDSDREGDAVEDNEDGGGEADSGAGVPPIAEVSAFAAPEAQSSRLDSRGGEGTDPNLTPKPSPRVLGGSGLSPPRSRSVAFPARLSPEASGGSFTGPGGNGLGRLGTAMSLGGLSRASSKAAELHAVAEEVR